jgi:ABC-type antimicrobial peptide transport system permease subunit
VTKEFLERFGYDLKTPVVYMAVALDKDNNEFVPVPVIAVLKELPGMTMFATTPYFRQLKKEPAKNNPFRRDGTNTEIILYTPGDTLVGNNLKNAVTEFFRQHPEYNDLSPWITLTENNLSYQKGFNINISFIGDLDIKDMDDIFQKLINSDLLESLDQEIIRFFNYKTYHVYNYTNYDYLAINFYDLSKIREFKNFFYKNYKLRIDIAQIEAKENYNYVSKLTLIISFLLIIFSVMVISMFISNLLSRHLDKIKSNIGTFKAFGISNAGLLKIYFSLTLWFVLSSLVVSFVLSALFGYLGGVRGGLTLVGATIEQNESYFDLFNFWLLASTSIIVMVSMVVIYYTANKILKRTPGDLIYNR